MRARLLHLIGSLILGGAVEAAILRAVDTTSASDTVGVVVDVTVDLDEIRMPYDSIVADHWVNGVPGFRVRTNKAFTVGERLVFDVGYGVVTAGEAVMEVAGYDFYRNRQCYRIQVQVRSLPFFSVFYKVDDRHLTLMDVEGLFPWRFEQRLREGNFRRDFSAEFDHERKKAITSEGEFPIPRYVHDAVSAFYYTRTLDFDGMQPGERITLQNFYKDSTYNLDVVYRGRQTVSVLAGRFRTIIIEPLMKEGGLFKSEGSIHIWLTDDERKIPVKVSSRILIGSITAQLREYSGLSGRIQAKVRTR